MFISSVVMIIGHIWMVGSSLLVLPKKTNVLMVLFASLWLLFNTFVDYRIGSISTHPWIPVEKLASVELYSWAMCTVWPIALMLLVPYVAKMDLIEKIRQALRINWPEKKPCHEC